MNRAKKTFVISIAARDRQRLSERGTEAETERQGDRDRETERDRDR